MEICAAIKQKSLELGFDLVGISDAGPIGEDESQILRQWVKNGHFAGMEYMARNLDKRIDPKKLFENAASVICVGLIYKPNFDTKCPKPGLCKVSDYAVYNDYHDYLKQRLHLLADFIHEIALPDNIQTKVCVDTAPVAERSLAVRAGLGFIGKNHMLINPDCGVEIFLGTIITDLELMPDEPVRSECGNCTKCVDACPTGALGKDGCFDANKCISYLTIENKSEIPHELAPKIGRSLYGCDMCVHACPYHQKAPAMKECGLECRPGNMWLDPKEILEWDQQTFDAHFSATPVERIGLERLKRNARVCLESIGT